ncbi:Rad51 domain-containing protein [Artemisia annua]|uniref:Rad51 domain-containing protein n=1 Tax=Artemisia annua TaxID=35608 RepID=A0A2U1ME64_ARTAN|nr:Rad51 domain-containing protein [Artemisia annua]
MLVASAEKCVNSDRLKQGINQLLSIVETCHQPWVDGLVLLEDRERNKHYLPTGFESFDMLLQGGFREGHVNELVGPSSSGKTQVCFQAASNVAMKLGGVVFLDSGNSFSPSRIKQIVTHISGIPENQLQSLDFQSMECSIKLDQALPDEVDGNLQQAMKNIECHSVFDIYALLNVLRQLKLNLKSQLQSLDFQSMECSIKLDQALPDEVDGNLQQAMKNIECHSVFDIYALLNVLRQLKLNLKSQTGYQVRLIIIDSISSLISPILGGSNAQGHALMVSIGYLLKELADRHNIAVVVTNHMVSGEGGTLKPALGESWKNVPHVRLQFSRDHASNFYVLHVLRHPFMVTNHMVSGGGTLKPALGESWKNVPHVRLQFSRDHASNFYVLHVLRHPFMGIGIKKCVRYRLGSHFHWYCFCLCVKSLKTVFSFITSSQGITFIVSQCIWQKCEGHDSMTISMARAMQHKGMKQWYDDFNSVDNSDYGIAGPFLVWFFHSLSAYTLFFTSK